MLIQANFKLYNRPIWAKVEYRATCLFREAYSLLRDITLQVYELREKKQRMVETNLDEEHWSKLIESYVVD